MSPLSAMSRYASEQLSDPIFGVLSQDHVQICPQNCIKKFDEAHAEGLMSLFPDTHFRLHANVKVLDEHHPLADLSSYKLYARYFSRLAELSKFIGAPAYTLHAGQRKHCSWTDILRFREKIEILMGVPVGIEGLYPTPTNKYWLDSWEGYAQLFKEDIPYALDLSHLHIIATQSGRIEMDLVSNMLASPNCIEVHVSHNDGLRDLHLKMPSEDDIWWLPLIASVREEAPIFYEGHLHKMTH